MQWKEDAGAKAQGLVFTALCATRAAAKRVWHRSLLASNNPFGTFLSQLQAGLSVLGDPSRLRSALHRLLVEKGRITITFIGASHTVGFTPNGLSMPQ